MSGWQRQVWKLTSRAGVCAATGKPFPPDTDVVTALFGQEAESEDGVRGSGFVRKDFLTSEASDDVLEGAYCVWHTRTPPASPDAERRLDLGLAREFLERLLAEGREDRAAVCMTLALLLARKRKLNIVAQEDEVLRVRWPREDRVFTVPAPPVSEADAESLQQELMRLFDLGGQPPS